MIIYKINLFDIVVFTNFALIQYLTGMNQLLMQKIFMNLFIGTMTWETFQMT